jgi:hypothetical protein
METDPAKQRLYALNFAQNSYKMMRRNRSYALNKEAQVVLAALARAMMEKRIAEGRTGADAKPTHHEEFWELIHKLDQAGVNLLQRRPGEPPRLPQVWRDPVTKNHCAIRGSIRTIRAV